MWFGTHDGLNKYDGYDFTVFHPDAEDPNAIKSNLIFALEEDIQGNLWIGTTGKGLAKFNKDTEQFVHFQNDLNQSNTISHDHVLSLHLDSHNKLWVGTSSGLNILDLTLKDSLETSL